MRKFREPTKRELDDLCRVLFEFESLSNYTWDMTIKTYQSPLLLKAMQRYARAAWRWHYEQTVLKELLGDDYEGKSSVRLADF